MAKREAAKRAGDRPSSDRQLPLDRGDPRSSLVAQESSDLLGVVGFVAVGVEPPAADPGQRRPLGRGRSLAPIAHAAFPHVVPVQEGPAVVRLGDRRVVKIHAPFLELPAQILRPLTIGLERILGGDLGRLAGRQGQAQVVGQLLDAGRRVGDEPVVTLRDRPRLARPEPIVGQNLVDHSLRDERLKTKLTLVHERKRDVANVPMSVNRRGPAFGQDAGEPAVLLVRLQNLPGRVIAVAVAIVEFLELFAVR